MNNNNITGILNDKFKFFSIVVDNLIRCVIILITITIINIKETND